MECYYEAVPSSYAMLVMAPKANADPARNRRGSVGGAAIAYAMSKAINDLAASGIFMPDL